MATTNLGCKFSIRDAKEVLQVNVGFLFFSAVYYATILHELIHATSHKSRLDRSFNAKRFGDNGYAREELVAELGAAFPIVRSPSQRPPERAASRLKRGGRTITPSGRPAIR